MTWRFVSRQGWFDSSSTEKPGKSVRKLVVAVEANNDSSTKRECWLEK